LLIWFSVFWRFSIRFNDSSCQFSYTNTSDCNLITGELETKFLFHHIGISYPFYVIRPNSAINAWEILYECIVYVFVRIMWEKKNTFITFSSQCNYILFFVSVIRDLSGNVSVRVGFIFAKAFFVLIKPKTALGIISNSHSRL